MNAKRLLLVIGILISPTLILVSVGLRLNDLVFSEFGLTASLIVLTGYLIYSSNAIEEYQRRLSNMQKISLDATL